VVYRRRAEPGVDGHVIEPRGQQAEVDVAIQAVAEILQRQVIARLEIHPPYLELTQVHRRVVDGDSPRRRIAGETAGIHEGDAIAERLLACSAQVDDVLDPKAERRARNGIKDEYAVPVGRELEALERARLRRDHEAKSGRIGFFRLEIDVSS